DAFTRLRVLQHRLARVTGRPSNYLDSCYRDTLLFRSSGAKPKETPLSYAWTVFSAMLQSVKALQAHILQDNTADADYHLARSFAHQVQWILRCIVEMESKFADVKDPEQAWTDGEMLIHNECVRKFLDGKAEAPDCDE
ncbi:hypothetical protein MPER_07086, partial [Moniliophthora perniciosa FA553]